MDESKIRRERPILATVIVAWTLTIAVLALLQAFHLPGSQSPPEAALTQGHEVLHRVLRLSESFLLIIGSVYLWKLCSIASSIFLAEFIVETAGAIYLTFIAPNNSMLAFKHSKMAQVVFAVNFSIEFARVWYVWRVTRDSSGTRGGSECLREN